MSTQVPNPATRNHLAGGVAYFSMEIEVEPAIPTYSGGLGVLAGDTLRGAADLGVPMIAVSLLHRKGYFRQKLDEAGNQTEGPNDWSPEEQLERLEPVVGLMLGDRFVKIQAWRYLVKGLGDHTVPVLFLDTDVSDNHPEDRALTDHLYGGDDRYRLCQEAVLGMGGILVLRALGYADLHAYHMNEGHSALLGLALLEERLLRRRIPTGTKVDLDVVKSHCVFTTHTPVPAGHDRFPLDLVRQVLGDERLSRLESLGGCVDGYLNMTNLALQLSHFVNGVAMRHGQIAQGMFPRYPISSITNGVHPPTWTAAPFQTLFDEHIPQWRTDSLNLRHALGLPIDAIRTAHDRAKLDLLAEVKRRTGRRLDPERLTLGFARRATPYKRADLLFHDLDRLRRISQSGPIQAVFAGKAHPQDEGGKEMIRRVFTAARELGDALPIVYLESYDTAIAKLLCSGVDVWLNTPQKPQEASGTSGMKAALNGVPSLSVLDGWWIEGHVEGVTGWSIGDNWESEPDREGEAASLYQKLERTIVPMFYMRPDAFTRIRRSAIALNGSFFSAHRMVMQYTHNAYHLSAGA